MGYRPRNHKESDTTERLNKSLYWTHYRKWKSLSCVWLSVYGLYIYSPRNSPGQNTGLGSLSLLQGIFPTQGWNPPLPHCRQILHQLSHKRKFSHFFPPKPQLFVKFLIIATILSYDYSEFPSHLGGMEFKFMALWLRYYWHKVILSKLYMITPALKKMHLVVNIHMIVEGEHTRLCRRVGTILSRSLLSLLDLFCLFSNSNFHAWIADKTWSLPEELATVSKSP